MDWFFFSIINILIKENISESTSNQDCIVASNRDIYVAGITQRGSDHRWRRKCSGIEGILLYWGLMTEIKLNWILLDWCIFRLRFEWCVCVGGWE